MDHRDEIGNKKLSGNLSNIDSSTIRCLTRKTRVELPCLSKTFTKVLILHHFDLKRHIQIKITSLLLLLGESSVSLLRNI